MTTKLKPCPFCGGEVKKEWDDHGHCFVVLCKGCCSIWSGGEFEWEELWNTRHGEKEDDNPV